MPKIRLLRIAQNYNFDAEVYSPVIDIKSPWQEVTDEELKLLKSWQASHVLGDVVIVEEITDRQVIEGYISDIKKYIVEEENRIKLREQKRKEEQKKRKETAEQRKLEKAKKLLESQGLKVVE